MAVQTRYQIFTTSSHVGVGGTIFYAFGDVQDIIKMNIEGNEYETENDAMNALERLDDHTLRHREFMILPVYRIVE